MKRLHLSREWYSTADVLDDARVPTPICGAKEGHTLKRGRGDGLVPPAAWGGDAHCSECYLRMMRDPDACDGA